MTLRSVCSSLVELYVVADFEQSGIVTRCRIGGCRWKTFANNAWSGESMWRTHRRVDHGLPFLPPGIIQ